MTLPRMRSVLPLLPVAVLLVPGSSATAQEWRPPVRVVPQVVVKAEVLGVRRGETSPLAAGRLEATERRPGRTSFALDFPLSASTRAGALDFEVRAKVELESRIRIELVTELTVLRPNAEPERVRRVRSVALAEGRSILLQAYEDPIAESSVILVLTPEERAVPELETPGAGAPIALRVVVSRAAPEGSAEIENTVLRTFEGAPVTYAFRSAVDQDPPAENRDQPSDPAAQAAGADAAAGPRYDSLELRLLPRRSADGILTVEAALEGTVQSPTAAGAPRRVLVSRAGALSNGATIEISVARPGRENETYRFTIQAGQ